MESVLEDPLFRNAVYMKSLVGKTVKFDTNDGMTYTGKVYVIDPIYKSVVLHTRLNSSESVTERENLDHDQNTIFLLRHTIKSLEIISDSVDSSYLEERSRHRLLLDADFEKQRLKKWLEQRLIKVQDKGDFLKIDDHLIILSPYTLDNCVCNNTIVLEKIRDIISSMPNEFS